MDRGHPDTLDYNYVPIYPFAILALSYWLLKVWNRQGWGPWVVVGFAVFAVALGVYFLPLAIALPISEDDLMNRVWTDYRFLYENPVPGSGCRSRTRPLASPIRLTSRGSRIGRRGPAWSGFENRPYASMVSPALTLPALTTRAQMPPLFLRARVMPGSLRSCTCLQGGARAVGLEDHLPDA